MINRQLLSVDGSLKIKNKKLLDDFSLIIEKGRWTTILGQSGVGKSTLLKLIAGLEIPGQFRGNIKLDSANHKIFSWMAQNDRLLPWLSVTKNVCLGQILRNEKLDHKKAEKLLKAVELENISRQLPDTLSVGMRQRVALARTLMEETEIVLMDEPFSSLDYITRSNIQNLSRKLLKNKTVIMVTHDPILASKADRILLLKDGRVVES